MTERGVWISGPSASGKTWLLSLLQKEIGYDLFDDGIRIPPRKRKRTLKFLVYDDIDTGTKTQIQKRVRQLRQDLRVVPVLVTSYDHPSKRIQGWNSLKNHFFHLKLCKYPFSQQLMKITNHDEKQSFLNEKKTLAFQSRPLGYKACDFRDFLVEIVKG